MSGLGLSSVSPGDGHRTAIRTVLPRCCCSWNPSVGHRRSIGHSLWIPCPVRILGLCCSWNQSGCGVYLAGARWVDELGRSVARVGRADGIFWLRHRWESSQGTTRPWVICWSLILLSPISVIATVLVWPDFFGFVPIAL